MDEHVRYQRPPVREMTCEFRFAGSGWDAALPGLLYVALKDHFPLREQRFSLAVASEADQSRSFEVSPVLQFKTADSTAFVQLAPNVISFHRRSPYPGWSNLRPVIARVFDVYRAEAKPDGLARVGLRYLNDFHFKEGNVDVEKYFNFYPTIGPSLPQNYTDLKLSLILMLEESNAGLRLQLHGIPSEGEAKTSLRLDLDYFPADGHVPTIGNAMEWVEQAHRELRSIFESCLTPNVRTLFG